MWLPLAEVNTVMRYAVWIIWSAHHVPGFGGGSALKVACYICSACSPGQRQVTTSVVVQIKHSREWLTTPRAKQRPFDAWANAGRDAPGISIWRQRLDRAASTSLPRRSPFSLTGFIEFCGKVVGSTTFQ